jgi:hypothetical protein
LVTLIPTVIFILLAIEWPTPFWIGTVGGSVGVWVLINRHYERKYYYGPMRRPRREQEWRDGI